VFAGLDLDCLAGGWIAAPDGQRALRTCRMPSPLIFTLSPFFKCLVIMTIRSSSIFWLARLLKAVLLRKCGDQVFLADADIGFCRSGCCCLHGIAP